MAPRLQLQAVLEDIVEPVYFQPPDNTKIKYPCIVYERDSSWTIFAGNGPYARKKRYQVTVIDRNPDSELPDEVEALPYCQFQRHFSARDLHHYVYVLFF
jgi:hypothetical protein